MTALTVIVSELLYQASIPGSGVKAAADEDNKPVNNIRKLRLPHKAFFLKRRENTRASGKRQAVNSHPEASCLPPATIPAKYSEHSHNSFTGLSPGIKNSYFAGKIRKSPFSNSGYIHQFFYMAEGAVMCAIGNDILSSDLTDSG